MRLAFGFRRSRAGWALALIIIALATPVLDAGAWAAAADLPADRESPALTVQPVPWTLAPAGATPITLQAALERTLAEHPDIQAAREKISEMQAKRAMVKNKRLLFFFRYFNASLLEGSAESDTQAAREHLEAVSQKALLNAASAYDALLRAILKSYLDFRLIVQEDRAMILAQRRFETGELTGLDVIEAKSRLLARAQAYEKSRAAVRLAQAQLALAMGGFPAEPPVRPLDLTFENGRFSAPTYQRTFPPLEALLAAGAIDQRPDAREWAFRRLSIANVLKANVNQFDKNQTQLMKASLSQLDMKLKRSRQTAQGGVIQATEELQRARGQLMFAQQRVALAQSALRQTEVSRKAGFSSEKDALDVAISDDQAQIGLISAQLDVNLTQFQLLYAIGDLTLESARALIASSAAHPEPSAP